MRRHVPELTITGRNQIARAREKNQWQVKEIDGLPLLFSTALKTVPWLSHAFTTRHGGNSVEPLESFNLARHWETAESKEDAMRNRERLCRALSLDHGKLAVPNQQHTSNVLWVDAHNATSANYTGIDALATQTPGQSLLLHFADCVPIIMVDPQSRAISVIHAGWRGTASGIVGNAIRVLVERGCNVANIIVAIGPAIQHCCFETGPDVAHQLATSAHSGGELIMWKDERPYPDLQALNALQAYEAGVGLVDVSAWCTACHPELFYSHRKSGGRTGRQGAIAGTAA